MFEVICYSVHKKEIASIDTFALKEDACAFIEEDSQNVYDAEIEQGARLEEMSYTLEYDYAYVSSYDGEYEWTWELCEIKEPAK